MPDGLPWTRLIPYAPGMAPVDYPHGIPIVLPMGASKRWEDPNNQGNPRTNSHTKTYTGNNNRRADGENAPPDKTLCIPTPWDRGVCGWVLAAGPPVGDGHRCG